MAGAAGGSAAGGLLSGIGKMNADRAQAEALTYQAESDDQNALFAKQAGAYDAALSGVHTAQKIGTATAAYGASGVEINSGSAADILAQSSASAELDRMNILHGADIRALHFSNQALLDRRGAKNAIDAIPLDMITSVAGGTTSSFANTQMGASSEGGSGLSQSDLQLLRSRGQLGGEAAAEDI